MDPGYTISLVITGVYTSTGSYPNTAQISGCTSLLPMQSSSFGGSGGIGGTMLSTGECSATVTGVIIPTPAPILSIHKTISGNLAQILVNELISYSITLTNTGNASASGILINEYYPGGFVYTSHSTSTGTYNPGTS